MVMMIFTSICEWRGLPPVIEQHFSSLDGQQALRFVYFILGRQVLITFDCINR